MKDSGLGWMLFGMACTFIVGLNLAGLIHDSEAKKATKEAEKNAIFSKARQWWSNEVAKLPQDQVICPTCKGTGQVKP